MNHEIIAALMDELILKSTERLHELEENAELSRTYHDGRTTAALRSVEKHRCIHILIQKLLNEIHSVEGNVHASD